MALPYILHSASCILHPFLRHPIRIPPLERTALGFRNPLLSVTRYSSPVTCHPVRNPAPVRGAWIGTGVEAYLLRDPEAPRALVEDTGTIESIVFVLFDDVGDQTGDPGAQEDGRVQGNGDFHKVQ